MQNNVNLYTVNHCIINEHLPNSVLVIDQLMQLQPVSTFNIVLQYKFTVVYCESVNLIGSITAFYLTIRL